MFAKVFNQIFDSSIAEDYNCRRMFIDLLVLADQTGAVDMTPDAIARRTNVPLEEVMKYIHELCQPDAKSRSQMAEGKRLIPLDSNRDWGWQIVNYRHYRDLRDEEARRSYFRDAMRRSRAKKKKEEEDTEAEARGESLLNGSTPVKAPLNTYQFPIWSTEEFTTLFSEWEKVRRGMGKAPKSWTKMFQKQLDWLGQYGFKTSTEILNASIRNNWQGLFEPRRNGTNGSSLVKPDSRLDRQYEQAQQRREREKQGTT